MRLTKFATVMWLSAATLVCPQTARAMTVEMYDAMAVEDQADYLKLLVQGARGVLIEEGRQDLAAQIEELFRRHHGESRSAGDVQLRGSLVTVRDYVNQADVKALRVKVVPGEVENALIGVLQKNAIPISYARFKALTKAWMEKPFWPKYPLRTTN